MNIYSRIKGIFARGETTPLDPRRGYGFYFPIPWMPDGLRLTPQQSLEVGTTWACVSIIGTSIAAAPWNVFERKAGKRNLLPDDQLWFLLNKRPNPEMTSQSFREGMVIQALLYGNAYAEIELDNANRVIALWPLMADRMLPPTRNDQGELIYEYVNLNGHSSKMEGWRLLHFRGPSIDGLMGQSIVSLAAKSIGTAAALDRFTASYFANSATPSGVLNSTTALNPKDREALKVEFANKYASARNNGKPLVLDKGLTWSPISNDPQKSQMVEARQFSVQDIARWFGVPLHLLQDPQGSQGYGSNQEGLGIQFTRYGLTPWAKRFEQEADYKLIPNRVPKETKIDLGHLAKGTAKEQAEADEIRIRSGVITPNEAREGMGVNDGPPELDNHFGLNTLTTLELIVEPPEPPAPALPAANDPAKADEGAKPPKKADPKKAVAAALALDAHARRWKARSKDLRDHHTEGDLDAKLAAAREELRAKLPSDLVALAEAVEEGALTEQVVIHAFEVSP